MRAASFGIICALAFGGCATANTAPDNRAYGASSNYAQNIGDILNAQGYAAIPLRRVSSGLDTLRVRVNGSQGTFLLDTGASNSVIDTRALPRFKITSRDLRRSDMAIGAGGEVRLSSYVISGFSVQGQTFPLPEVSATDLSPVITGFARDTGIRLDGIIGQDVMIAFDGVVDTKNRTLFLRRPQN